MKPTYYGFAGDNKGRFGILAVTKIKGQPIQQEWTGETCATFPDAEARVEALNRELLAVAS